MGAIHVENGAVFIVPKRYDKTYFHWIDNLRDWCISRQIWFGHRIPAWYKGEETKVSIESPGKGWEQDSDVLDTWFSSGLWTFSTLGWPEETSDLKPYHPTSILETGYDILFFWVARMILMSGFLLGQVPFKKVYLHGLVRDGQGRKISKSLGNNIDPLDMSAKYGSDAVRVSLIAGMAPGTDSKISEEKIRGYKHFANKLWNIARFVLENYEADTAQIVLTERDEFMSELAELEKNVSIHIDTFRLDIALESLYHFIWDRFAAEIIEESKITFKQGSERDKVYKSAVIYRLFTTSLKLLHPFMPFVTEAIWQKLPQKDADILIVAKWPVH